MKNWAVVDSDEYVVHGFDATDEVAEGTLERVSEMSNLPDWYNDTLSLVDISEVKPRPVVGFYKNGDGLWVDGNPFLTVDRETIPADGSTAAVVSFSQSGSKAPESVTFEVNGTEVEELLVSGTAICEVVSSNPGDVIVVSANGASVTITVEG